MTENLLFSLNSTLPLFFVMALGYILRRTGFLSESFIKGANDLVYYVSLPVLLFRDLSGTDIYASFDAAYVGFCAFSTIAGILVIWAGAKLLLRDKSLVGEFVQASYRSSAAILGAAFIANIYGTSGASGLMILGSVPLYNIFAVLILELESPRAKRAGSLVPALRESGAKILRNPILIGIALGFAASLLRLPVPPMVDKALSSLASLTSPLALLCVGAGFKGRAALAKLGPTAVATALKLVVLPAAFLPLAVRLGFADQKLVALIVMLGCVTTPTAYVMARQTGYDGTLTGSVCAATTVCSALTLTFWLFWARSGGYL